ncbi:MAG: lipid A deacylase LpxR family protein [Granulosicoccaceae bacterium]
MRLSFYRWLFVIGFFSAVIVGPLHAEEIEQWRALTLDNDLFLGDDSGYTNGLFYSGFAMDRGEDALAGFLLKPMLWTLPKTAVQNRATAFSWGQMLGTPNDISLADPPLDEPPYGALLFYSKSYVQVEQNTADMITTTIGLVGPSALGEPAQSFVHKLTGSEPPMGWHTQIRDEVVFGFSRGWLWRNWVAPSDQADILSLVDIELGTIKIEVNGELMWRYGVGLSRSFATPLLASNRASNPLAVDHGWYVFASLQAGSRLRHILVDGNNFKDSRSLDYKHEYVGFSVGATHAWSNAALTFAMSNSSVLQELDDDQLDNVTQFGSLTFAWRLDPARMGQSSWPFESEEARDERRR